MSDVLQPDATVLQQVSASALTSLLDKINGPKTLVLCAPLAGPLGLVTDVAWLKNNNGVTKLFWLEPGPLTQAERNIVYLCTPQVKWMHIIADQIKSAPNGAMHNYHLLVTPRMNPLCQEALSNAGVLGSIDVQEYQMGLIPIDKDVLSLEQDHTLRSIALDRDFTPVHDMARSIMTIQKAFGAIPRIVGKGDCARRLVNALRRLANEEESPQTPVVPFHDGMIDSMIVLDRTVDLVTPLCTQLTYEGLIDEVIGIKNSHIDVDPSLVNPPPAASTSSPSSTHAAGQASKKKKHLLSAKDNLFAELRDRNFAVVGSILNKTARRLNDDYEKRHSAKTPAELHLVAGVELNAQAAAIREFITQEAPLRVVLRLLSLYSLVTGGLKPKVLEEFKRDILQTYGYQHLTLLVGMQDLGLLSSNFGAKSAFAQSRKPLRLIVDDVDEQSPKDASYVFSGYAPLSIRLVQCALGKNLAHLERGSPGAAMNGWRGIEDVLGLMPGETFEELQPVPHSLEGSSPVRVPTTAICFLGGVTFAEIAALRFLSRQSPRRSSLYTGFIYAE
ncbi:Vacuolar protein-sorting-associated protein 33 [Microbotryomycetes sp. JL201]|nr:Vacuolar protein-sorting-associated protein 33 [Microbotryomycetes sp. JL201]